MATARKDAPIKLADADSVRKTTKQEITHAKNAPENISVHTHLSDATTANSYTKLPT